MDESRHISDLSLQSAPSPDEQVDPEIRATIAVYDEGDGLRSMFLSRCTGATRIALTNALGIQSDMICLSDPHPPEFPPFPKEWLHRPEHTDSLSGLSLLAAPNATLEANPNCRLGYVQQDEQHAIVYSSSDEVLRTALQQYLAQIVRTDSLEFSTVWSEQCALDALLVPNEPDSWCEVTFQRSSRLLTLEFATVMLSERGETCTNFRARWVRSAQQLWRADWLW